MVRKFKLIAFILVATFAFVEQGIAQTFTFQKVSGGVYNLLINGNVFRELDFRNSEELVVNVSRTDGRAVSGNYNPNANVASELGSAADYQDSNDKTIRLRLGEAFVRGLASGLTRTKPLFDFRQRATDVYRVFANGSTLINGINLSGTTTATRTFTLAALNNAGIPGDSFNVEALLRRSFGDTLAVLDGGNRFSVNFSRARMRRQNLLFYFEETSTNNQFRLFVSGVEIRTVQLGSSGNLNFDITANTLGARVGAVGSLDDLFGIASGKTIRNINGVRVQRNGNSYNFRVSRNFADDNNIRQRAGNFYVFRQFVSPITEAGGANS